MTPMTSDSRCRLDDLAGDDRKVVDVQDPLDLGYQCAGQAEVAAGDGDAGLARADRWPAAVTASAPANCPAPSRRPDAAARRQPGRRRPVILGDAIPGLGDRNIRILVPQSL